MVVMSSVLNSSGCLVVYVDKIFEVGIEVDLHLYADKRRFFIKIITTFFSVIIVLIDQVYERSVHFSPVALCSRYLQTAIYCLLSVGISFSYFLSRASIQWKYEQVIASIISTVQLFTACVTCSKIFMSPPPQDQVLNSMVYRSIFAKFCSSFTP